MQELRFVLIVVGLLAIAALLFHGLWTSRKEGKSSKFSDKPLGKMEEKRAARKSAEKEKPSRSFFSFKSKDESETPKIKKKRKEPGFEVEEQTHDPLIDPSFDNIDDPLLSSSSRSEDNYLAKTVDEVEHELDEEDVVSEPVASTKTVQPEPHQDVETPEDDEGFEVIVLSVHCSGNTPFVGTELFDSMQQNGLLYGEMDIYHRHADLSGTGKVLFSVANMMQPGTLKHDDPETFTTKGISFFMTLPCFGDPEQNFKLMLKTAQQIADDLGGNVLDEQRNLITPDKLDKCRRQIQQFKARSAK
ncbi:cell division protein ZipA [Vibrio viridaestus]|uniref:Cell division protein ZipA n=1 Tax=Vibrio viridaestus TaxID=2487322 RepID=A0A3N9U362_9VIBR|nr:cell division protein ZipA [Vibrio viridaestus]RQW62476.1 cell division protein ZipA [Vibrio viridaestus]